MEVISPERMSNDFQATVKRNHPSEPEKGERQTLVVIQRGQFRSFPIRSGLALTIGRDSTCEIRIDDPSLSRTHARLLPGQVLRIEDLDSSNGTLIGGKRLQAHTPTPISFNQIIELGELSVFVQSIAHHHDNTVKILNHRQFEDELSQRCSKQSAFGLLYLASDEPVDMAAAQEALGSVCSQSDVVGCYGAAALEIATDSLSREALLNKAKACTDSLSACGISVRVGYAEFPQQGAKAGRLVEIAMMDAAKKKTVEAPTQKDGPIVRNPAMQHLWTLAARVAKGEISVLILGETGVGKEVLAEHVHQSSPRAKGPFIRLNCGALSSTLLESELFGYEKGAFTGADKPKPGLIEAAEGGTLFLDELGEAPMEVQVRLLRVLEESKVLRLGALQPRPVDVRIIGATNRNIEEEIEHKRFRQDLYYRIAGVTLPIPALRNRPEDLMPLTHSIVAQAAMKIGIDAPSLTQDAAQMLMDYHWPGNIRELRNILERATLLQTSGYIHVDDLPNDKLTRRTPHRQAPVAGFVDETTNQALPREHAEIIQALADCGGNQTLAARQLGIDRKTLGRRMNKYKIARPRKDHSS